MSIRQIPQRLQVNKEVAQITVRTVQCMARKPSVMVFEFYCGHSTTEAYDKDLFNSYVRSMSEGAVYKRCVACEEEVHIKARETGRTYEELVEEMHGW